MGQNRHTLNKEKNYITKNKSQKKGKPNQTH